MSPPEVWGPAVWTLFHTLVEHLNDNAYPHVVQSLYQMFVRICQVLPCPDCSRDASQFLAKIRVSDYKTKDEFKTMMYLFHNWVNAKKRKPLYNYSDLGKYSSFSLQVVIQDFINKYHTRGNMKLLSDSFQRQLVIREFIDWFKQNARAFYKPPTPTITTSTSASDCGDEKTAIDTINESTVTNDDTISEDKTVLDSKEPDEITISLCKEEEKITKKKRTNKTKR